MLQRMRDNDVVAALNICTTLEEFPAVVAVAEQHAHVFASAGVHPDNQGVEEPTVERLVELADHPKESWQSAKRASTTFAFRSPSIGSAPDFARTSARRTSAASR